MTFRQNVENQAEIVYNQKMSSKNKNWFYDVSALGSFFLFACILLNNAFYGFGWTDEALYSATVHQIWQGQRPFFDIWEPTQIYEILLYPLHALFLKFNNGRTEGIYLYYRILTIIFQFATVAFAYFTLSKRFNKILCTVFCCSFLMFSRACLYGPSYYTFVLLAFIISLCMAYRALGLGQSKTYLFFTGIFLGISILCNPYLVLPYILASLIFVSFPYIRPHYKKYTLVWAGTILIGLFYLLFVFAKGNIKQFPRALHYFFSSPEYSGKSLLLRVKWLLKFPRLFLTPFFYFLPFSVFSLILIKNNNLRLKLRESLKFNILYLVLLAANYLLLTFFRNDECGIFIVGFFYTTVFLYIFYKGFSVSDVSAVYKKYKESFLFFLIPGLSLSFMMCLASDTGFGVFSIGMTVVLFSTLPIFEDIINSASLKKTLALVFPVILLLGTFFIRINYVYRDEPLPPHILFIPSHYADKIQLIDKGPAKGLYTGNKNKIDYDKIYTTIFNIDAKDGDTFLISNLCPWAYLVNPKLKMNTPSAWRIKMNDLRLEPYFEEFKNPLPDYVLIIDENIRDNNSNDFENSWLMKKIISEKYQEYKTECGYLFKKSNL